MMKSAVAVRMEKYSEPIPEEQGAEPRSKCNKFRRVG